MAGDTVHTVAVIGAGPRGSSVVERLAANWRSRQSAEQLPEDAKLHVHLIDPYPIGSGHVWQPEQSRQFLMNTQSFFPTLVPEDPQLAAPLVGRTFDQWRESVDAAALSAAEQAELAHLAATDFPSRALYGRYLENTMAELVQLIEEQLPGFTLTVHTAEVLSAVQTHDGGFRLALSAAEPLAVDRVVLALGHVPAQLNPQQKELQHNAAELGLRYFPPACPADVLWDQIPAGEPVLIRGMGLNFFDVMAELTLGRGGRFVDGAAGELAYLPSGREPLLRAASRRGGPYRAKADINSYYAQGYHLRYLTAEAVERFARVGLVPGFNHDLWPLLQRDVMAAYYEALVTADPDLVEDAETFLEGLAELLHPHSHSEDPWLATVGEYLDTHIPAEHRLELRRLAMPFEGQRFDSAADFDAAVLKTLEDDAAASARGEADPNKIAALTLHAGRSVLKAVVADGGITEESWLTELRGRFESLVEGLASGPPSLRIRQLAALVRAGIVSFVGPEPRFAVDRALGVFTAVSPWVEGGPVQARTMVEALAPSNWVAASDSALLRSLMDNGLLRSRLMMLPEGGPVETSGLDVVPNPYRAVNSAGEVQENLHVLSLQLSSTQWGTAIAGEAYSAHEDGSRRPHFPSGQRTQRDADEIARAILDGL